jgi:hypothetical protein
MTTPMPPIVSRSEQSTFNEDFGATVDGEEIHSVSVFLRDRARVFHTDRNLGPISRIMATPASPLKLLEV